MGVGEAAGIAKGIACGTHRSAVPRARFRVRNSERTDALELGDSLCRALTHTATLTLRIDANNSNGISTLQHHHGKNSTSCDKSNPKCSTAYSILLRDIWFFQYFDFCSRRSRNELGGSGVYRKRKHTVTGTDLGGFSSAPTR